MPGGRPTIYSDEMVRKARLYVKGGFKNPEEPGEDPEVIPTVEGLAYLLGISVETCYVWAKEEGKEEFSEVLAELKKKQARILLSGGLAGGYSPVISKLLLVSKHGYEDKSQVEHSGSLSLEGLFEAAKKD